MPRLRPNAEDSRRGAQQFFALLLPLLVAGCNLTGCATKPADLQAELYLEDQQPYFKTCLARHDGTYHVRELQQHRFIDIKEPLTQRNFCLYHYVQFQKFFNHFF